MEPAFRSSTAVLLAYMASVSAQAAGVPPEDEGIVLKPSRSISAFAAPVSPVGTEGQQIFVNATGSVTATYQGSGASFSNDLYLMLDAAGKPGNDSNPANDKLIFSNRSSSVGEIRDLGVFESGTALPFRLHVNDTGNDYFTGPASLNPDGEFHARAQNNWLPDTALVSFEDLLYSYDRNFNDLSSSFSNTIAAIPEPENYALLLAGLGVIGAIVRRRRKSDYRAGDH
jgi:hypothetical protein